MLFKGIVTFGEIPSTNKACCRRACRRRGCPPSVINAAKPRQPHLSTPTEMATEMETLSTPTEMATEMETVPTVPTVLAVRVEVRAYA